jgi:hypothetical protein
MNTNEARIADYKLAPEGIKHLRASETADGGIQWGEKVPGTIATLRARARARAGVRARFALAPVSIKLLGTMGGYKGRTNVRHRKRRSAKAERIKANADAKKETAKKTA